VGIDDLLKAKGPCRSAGLSHGGGGVRTYVRMPKASAQVDPGAIARLLAGDHDDPHALLGPHGDRVRAFHPDAASCELLVGGAAHGMETVGGGLFEATLAGLTAETPYRLRFGFTGGAVWERDDPYRFPPAVGALDLHLFHEGTHRRLWEVLGARVRTMADASGVSFAVWAPNARRVSVVGDFARWDGRLFPMRRHAGSGVFELFVPGLAAGAVYKFEIKTREGMLRLKTDPMARAMEVPPRSASIVEASSHVWDDDVWMKARRMTDHARTPLAAYEVHLGAWAAGMAAGGPTPGYRDIAQALVAHVKALGFTHVELMPVAEHPFAGSWGYQISGYYAPTSRFGSPDDFRAFVDHCHANGIGVIVDWVPAHFPKDDFALRRFDGTALYEHDDPRQGEHPDWGTLIFNLGRPEVSGFLIANALYWLRELHVDGLRVDAVASMLYLDYSRKDGEWIPNRHGGRENLDAIDFFVKLHAVVREDAPGAFTIAEESTSWPLVTADPSAGGLGFDFKWNMGWMHDTLAYFAVDPIGRTWHHDRITFAMIYEYSERFINPLSHDEVVHGKKSLLAKMPGPEAQQFASLRLLYAYMWTRPGKKLLFMGSELAPWWEWNEDRGPEWALGGEPFHRGVLRVVTALGDLYRRHSCLWRDDHAPGGFQWIDCLDRENSVLTYLRRDGDDRLVVVLNLTPVTHPVYRVGAPVAGKYTLALNTDDPAFDGTGFAVEPEIATEAVPMHGHPQSLALRLPPLAALVLAPVPVGKSQAARSPAGSSRPKRSASPRKRAS
jgi:1,4-alpha-glucan branching enzyme